jgi:septum formation protein
MTTGMGHVPPLILASGSAARRQILTGAGVPFVVQPADIDEEILKEALLAKGQPPIDIAQALACAKAVARSKQTPGLVIGADQTLDLNGTLFNKAASLADAESSLRLLRGKTHQLHSATALALNGQLVWQEVVSASLTMRDFSDRFLSRYLEQQGPAILSCVGGYQLESHGVQLFEQIEGDYFTILGLPLSGLLAQLRQWGVLDQ